MELQECCGVKPSVGSFKSHTGDYIKYVTCKSCCGTMVNMQASKTDLEVCESWNGIAKGEA